MNTTKRKLTYLFILVVNFVTCGHGQGSELILWPGTRAYAKRIESFSFTAEEVRNLLVNKTRGHPHGYFDAVPTFVAGDEYFFEADLSKTENSLHGFYINGITGTIEYRKSAVSIKKKRNQRLPEDAFTDIEKIE